uniref:Putative 8.9 kDa family member n=1 Tax=Hyalomma excavatum TaxID=257692 RepID=A0A131XL60_9ACAR
MARTSVVILLLATYAAHTSGKEDCTTPLYINGGACVYFGERINDGNTSPIPEPICANVTCHAKENRVTVKGCVDGTDYPKRTEGSEKAPYPQCCDMYAYKTG